MMKETSLTFGPESNLIGTIARPAKWRTDVGALLLNAGVIARIGPHRLNVKLARHLASQGMPSLRFDAAGLGDSAASSHGLPWERQAVADLRAAMDCLEAQTGARRFVVIGLCSGADTGYAAALEDERIAGLIMIDPYAYPTPRSHLIRIASRIRERGLFTAVGAWARRRLRNAGERLGKPPAGASRLALPRYSRNAPSRNEFGNGLQNLVNRGVRIYMIYTAGAQDFYNHPGQFAAAFSRWPFVREIECEYVPALDHMITAISAQRSLISKVSACLDRAFADSATAPASPALRHQETFGVKHERAA